MRILLHTIAVFALSVPLALAQATIPVTGSKAINNLNQPLTGKFIFTVTDAADNPVTYTPSGGSPTTATVTANTISGVVQNSGGFPPAIPNPLTMSPSNTRYRIAAQNGAGSFTYYTVPLININTSSYSVDSLTSPTTAVSTGIGRPQIQCSAGSQYTQLDASYGYNWVCSQQPSEQTLYWVLNPAASPAQCPNPLSAYVSNRFGQPFCISSLEAYALNGYSIFTPSTGGPGPFQVGPTPPPPNVVTSINSLVGNVTLAAGSNITLTPSGNTITIAGTAGGTVTRAAVIAASGRVQLGVSTDAVLLAGDSIPCGWNATAFACQTAYNYSTYLKTLNQLGAVSSGNWYDTAVAGQTCENLLSNYATQIHPYRPSVLGTTNTYLFLDVGTNSLNTGLDTAATLMTCQNSIMTLANADSFKTILVTIRPRGQSGSWNGAQEYQRQLYRDLSLAAFNAASPAYFAIIDTDSLYSDPYNATYLQSDALHPTPVGQAAFAEYVNLVLGSPNANTGAIALRSPAPSGSGTGNFGCQPYGFAHPFPSMASGSANTSCGIGSMGLLASGTGNTSFGYGNLPNITSPNYNTAIGLQNLTSLTTGTQNFAGGSNVGTSMTTASYNVMLGQNAGAGQVAPNSNVCLGYASCTATGGGDMGTDNVAIGGLNANINNGVQHSIQLGQGTNSVSNSVQFGAVNMGAIGGSGFYDWYVNGLFVKGTTPSTKAGCVYTGNVLIFDDAYCTALPSVSGQTASNVSGSFRANTTNCGTAGTLYSPNASGGAQGCIAPASLGLTLAAIAAGVAPTSSGTYDFANNNVTTTGTVTAATVATTGAGGAGGGSDDVEGTAPGSFTAGHDYMWASSANHCEMLNNNATGSACIATNPMTTLGDVIYGGASGVMTRLSSPTTSGHTYLYGWTPSGSAIAPAALDLATILNTPPPIGSVTPSTGIFSTSIIGSAGGTATSGANFGSGNSNWAGSYWNGSAATADQWSAAIVMGSGTNPTSRLTFAHTGTSGASAVSVPALIDSGLSGAATSPICANGSGGLLTNVGCGGNISMLSSNSTVTTVTNSTTEAAIETFTLPANIIGIGNGLMIKIFGNNSFSSSNQETVKLKCGWTGTAGSGTTLASFTPGAAPGAVTNAISDYNFLLRSASAAGASPTFEVQGDMFWRTASGTLSGSNIGIGNTATVTGCDTSASSTYAVTITFSGASASDSMSGRVMTVQAF